MFRQMFRTSCTLCSAVIAPKAVVSEDVNEGWERVKRILERDEIGMFSPEVNTVLQNTFFTAIVGGCYGGVMHSKEAYLRFFERNQATKFTDHFEAKKKLQDYVIINFAKGAAKWSWRLALFGSLYTATVTVLSTYRGNDSILDFVLAGLVAGGMYRINYGVRGVVVGSTLGIMMGLFAGSLTLTFLKMSDKKMDDIRRYQQEMAHFKEKTLAKAVEAPQLEALPLEIALQKSHDSALEQRLQSANNQEEKQS